MDINEEVVPGLSSADVKDIADRIFSKKDGNHEENHGFVDILENAEPYISASPIFVRRVSLDDW